ncbi:MAG: UvrD-helicase domain-containing protein, partial [Hyphomicrobiales bacterium]
MTPFDPVHTPLEGISLIEAAAGTGKTYTIEGLYLRLVLEKQMPVEQILVVTFTRAATAELRDRIYKRLARARNAFAGTPVVDDELLDHLTAHYPSRSQADRLLRQALMDFDRAAIFTIHGFCQRVLYENAFETGSAFNAELLQDQTKLLTEVVEDFWRQRVCDQPPEFLRFAQRTLSGPGALMELARKSTTAEYAVMPRQDRPCLQAETLASFRHQLDRIKSSWRDARDDVRRILTEAALNGRNYGALKPGERGGPPPRVRMVHSLIEAMDAYVSPPGPEYPLIAAVEKLASSTLARHTLRGGRTPIHPVFDSCEALLQAGRSLELEMTGHLHYLKGSLLEFSQTELERRKAEKGLVSFDDLLRRVARALNAHGGHELAGAVRRRFQAALVDEFQDTDELQYVVFLQLFSSPQHLLFMIGDPKQAIYGFRGADIFSYLRAARQAGARFTLSRNWRSSPGLIQAINALFARSPAPFLFSG